MIATRDIVTLGPELERWQDLGLESLRYKYDLKPGDTVFDIGSYRKEFAGKIKEMYNCRVECFDALDDRAAATYYGEIEMGGNFLYTSYFEKADRKKFRCVDLNDQINNEVALMKMNVEGYEYILIPHLIRGDKMKFIKNLQVQFHLIDGNDSEMDYEAIYIALSQTHSITWRYPFVWENWERK